MWLRPAEYRGRHDLLFASSRLESCATFDRRSRARPSAALETTSSVLGGYVAGIPAPHAVGRGLRPRRYAKPELFYAATREELAERNYSLVPSRYIEFVDRDTELDYKTALKTIGAQSAALVERQVENGLTLVKALKKLGY